MSIICNTRCLNANLTGVQRYTQKILEAFPEKIETLAPDVDSSRGIQGHLWEQFILPGRVHGDLLWSPSNSGPLKHIRQVVTLHDVVSMDHPEWFNKPYVRWYNYLLPKLCKNAEHIITISNFSKRRILENLNVPENKVSVIYNGTDTNLTLPTASSEPLNVPFKRYVLSLGSLEPRKNIPFLLKAWQNIIGKIPEDIGLVIVGAKGNVKIFKDAGIDPMQERVFFTGQVSDAQITQLYKSTLLFAYLSVYEGFGLPPLEAMSAGIPVITGDQTSLPEVVGDGAIMIDPYSLSECENEMIALINSEQRRNRLAARAILQATKFDWKDTAQQTWDVLQKFN